MLRSILFMVVALAIIVSPAFADQSVKLSDKKIERTITKAARFVDVPPHLLLAVCWIESHYQTNLPEVLDGETPSYGICQIKLETAQDMDAWYRHKIPVTIERLRDPYLNAFYAAKYLKYQLKRYDGDWKKAVAAYNQGSFFTHSPNKKYVLKVQLAIRERGLN